MSVNDSSAVSILFYAVVSWGITAIQSMIWTKLSIYCFLRADSITSENRFKS